MTMLPKNHKIKWPRRFMRLGLLLVPLSEEEALRVRVTRAGAGAGAGILLLRDEEEEVEGTEREVVLEDAEGAGVARRP